MKLASLLLLIILVLPATAAMRGGPPTRSAPESNAANAASRGTSREATENNFDLSAFGAIGDGVADDGPALQSALNAIADAGGGTLFVPAGRYAINTPVQKNFTGLATSVTIKGVESSTPVPPPTAGGNELTRGLDLVSEFAPGTGETQNAITISGLETFLVKDIIFIGTPGVITDALITLALYDISDATIRHCEFYGLASFVAGAAIVLAVRSDLTFEQSVVLGSACSSGVYSSIIQNLEWKGITISEAVFADYGQRPELYGKMENPPLSWISIGNAAAPDNDSPRREAIVRSVFLDEGGYIGISSLTYMYSPPSAPIDLLYITDLFINVSNLASTGSYLYGLDRVLIEKSHYGWSHNADSAITFLSVGNAIIDEVDFLANANRIRADAATGKLTIINSSYTHLDSQAQTTKVITAATPDEDPVQHVRQQFMATLGRSPDPAAHFYWSDLILRCGADTECVAGKQAELAAYLESAPSPIFAINGRVTDDSGASLPGAAVTLSGSQSVTTTTDSAGQYHFSNLPTSGVYTITPTLKHHTLNPGSRTIVTPAADQLFDSAATLNYHAISGRVTDTPGNALADVTVTLSGTQNATTTTGADGNYSFGNLPAGGNYTVTTRKTSHTFYPTSDPTSFYDLGADQNLNFIGTFVFYTISGYLRDVNGDPKVGVTVTLSGGQNRTTISNGDGHFHFTGVPSELNYTVTPLLIGYSFSPSSRNFSNLNANHEDSSVATYTTHTISGRVTEATSGTALSGAVVTVSGHTSGATTTDANGNYSYELPRHGTYTLTVAKAHHTLAQPSQTFTNLTSNQTGNFAATVNRHSITGRAAGPDGSALAGVTVTLSGSQTSTTTTDANGEYAFANMVGGGSYTVKPSKSGYSWAPQSLVFNDLGASQSANFAGTFVTHNISGRVTENGAGLSGVSILLSGSQTSSATTDASGSYSFNLPSEGNYTVTPSKQHYTFTPGSLTFNNLVAVQTGDFAATRNRHPISGRVTENGAGLSGVSVLLSGSQTATATTDASGNYSFDLPSEGNYTVTPSKQHYTFTPGSLTFNNLVSTQTAADFAATLNRHTISGRVVNINNTGVAGITVSLSGSQAATATTDSAGDYSFASLPAAGAYSVSPSLQYHSFTPASQTYANLGSNQQGLFVAKLNTHTISGRLTDITGSPIEAAAVAVSGSLGPIATITTGADGNYSFSSLPEGSAYFVAVSKLNYIFSPASSSFSALLSSQTANFSGTLQRVIEFSAASYSVAEGSPTITITVHRTGDTSTEAEVTYSASNGTGTLGKDTGAVIGQLLFAPGETTRTFTIFITDDAFVESVEQLTVTLSAPEGGTLGSLASTTLTINDNDSGTGNSNPVDEAQFFVRQHYRDFLNREPDAAGLAFWSNQILACGTNAACVEDRRINVSAAFFLSIEFQETGFLIHRLYQASFAQSPKYLNEFLLDARTIAQGVVVDAPGWQQLLEANKAAYLNDFVERSNFRTLYPLGLTPTEFVNSLNAKGGSPLLADGISAAVAEFNGSTTSAETSARARVLRRIAESETLSQRELSPAFVLMQYFGYMQRNPTDPPDNSLEGYNFWLSKLDEFGGDFRNAQMVKSFLVSGEYRSRFGL